LHPLDGCSEQGAVTEKETPVKGWQGRIVAPAGPGVRDSNSPAETQGRRAIAAAKDLVNQVSLPSADRLLDAITSFETALTWPETQRRVQAVLKLGLQQDADYEKRWTDKLGTLLETRPSLDITTKSDFVFAQPRPEAADFGIAASRQLSGVHRTCCQCHREGSP
jgi:hypothetical protein